MGFHSNYKKRNLNKTRLLYLTIIESLTILKFNTNKKSNMKREQTKLRNDKLFVTVDKKKTKQRKTLKLSFL